MIFFLNQKNKKFILLTIVFICFLGTHVLADERLLYKNNFTYLGEFRLPNDTLGGSRAGYGGNGLTTYHDPNSGKNTIFLQGHPWYPGYIGQFEIPANFSKSTVYNNLPQANVLQNFYDITDGKMNSLGSTTYNQIFGMLAYNGRLIVGAADWYDADGQQVNSHGYSSLDLSQPNDFSGFLRLSAVAGPRSLGGYMTTIPNEWKAAFGGPALTGNAALSIISSVSSGPAASVFNPDDLGSINPVPATTVLFYDNPATHYLTSGIATDNTFTYGSTVKGVAFPAGSRSVLFVGRQTMAQEYCYGEGVTDKALDRTYCDPQYPTVMCCYDLCSNAKGGHGYPYYHYVWAYDANDLLKVKNGDINLSTGQAYKPWEIKPYAAWTLDEMNSSGCGDINGATYDPITRNLYIAQDYGESPKIDVYNIGFAVNSYSNSEFINLVSNWFKKGTISDLNYDNIVNAKDLGTMMSKWN